MYLHKNPFSLTEKTLNGQDNSEAFVALNRVSLLDMDLFRLLQCLLSDYQFIAVKLFTTKNVKQMEYLPLTSPIMYK